MSDDNSASAPVPDVIDRAAGLVAASALWAVRRQRPIVVQATQASHDALLFDPVQGLSVADRLRVALACCDAAQAGALASHYRRQLLAQDEAPAAALPTMQAWACTLTTDPRHGDRAAIASLYAAGLSDAAIVALAQLVAFLAYQMRLVAGLRAMAEPGVVLHVMPASDQAAAGAATAAAPAPLIRRNGFTNETLGWRSWLQPLAIEDATPLQLAVLDESHAQARSSEYYRTLVHQPWMLRHRSAAYNAIMYAPGGAPRHERELAAMAVSVTNGCVYCTSVHAQRYAQLARRHDTVEQVFSDTASAGSTPRERAVVTLARALTLQPAALHQADIAPLRAQGLADDQILDVLQAAAIFGWANRLMHNLGEPVAPDAA